MTALADAAVGCDNGEIRYQAVIADPLTSRDDSDSLVHSSANCRWPLRTDGTLTLGLTLTHRLTPSGSNSLARGPRAKPEPERQEKA